MAAGLATRKLVRARSFTSESEPHHDDDQALFPRVILDSAVALCSRRAHPIRGAKWNALGKILRRNFYGDKDSIDTIEFLPDGKCIIDLGDGAGGLSGSYHGISDGKLTLEYGNPKIVRSYKAALGKRMLTLTEGDDSEASFVLRPDPPYPNADDLLGIFMAKRESGDFSEISVYRRTADHNDEALFRYLSNKDHTLSRLPFDSKMDLRRRDFDLHVGSERSSHGIPLQILSGFYLKAG